MAPRTDILGTFLENGPTDPFQNKHDAFLFEVLAYRCNSVCPVAKGEIIMSALWQIYEDSVQLIGYKMRLSQKNYLTVINRDVGT